jgi:hypothetical protein
MALVNSLRYFAASRRLLDVTNCTDETSLQAIVFLNLFLVGTVRVATCYTYAAHALTLALRMGLHRSLPRNDDLVAREVGRRTFWTIRLLVNYLAAACGMPKLLDDDNVDQAMPVEVNDAYITTTQILSQPADEVCEVAGMNAYVKLHKILEQVVKHIYPFRGTRNAPARKSVSYMVSIEKIREIEKSLKEWMANLPSGFRLGNDPAHGSILR